MLDLSNNLLSPDCWPTFAETLMKKSVTRRGGVAAQAAVRGEAAGAAALAAAVGMLRGAPAPAAGSAEGASVSAVSRGMPACTPSAGAAVSTCWLPSQHVHAASVSTCCGVDATLQHSQGCPPWKRIVTPGSMLGWTPEEYGQCVWNPAGAPKGTACPPICRRCLLVRRQRHQYLDCTPTSGCSTCPAML